jgi:hypothetical protein
MENDRQIEIDVAEWIIENSNHLEMKIKSLYSIKPEKLWANDMAIYNDAYKENVIAIIKNEAYSTLNVNPEQLSLLINEELIEKINNKLLHPQ